MLFPWFFHGFPMLSVPGKLRIITLYKLCPVQAQAVQENAKRPRAGCNIQLIKILMKSLVPNSCYIEI